MDTTDQTLAAIQIALVHSLTGARETSIDTLTADGEDLFYVWVAVPGVADSIHGVEVRQAEGAFRFRAVDEFTTPLTEEYQDSWSDAVDRAVSGCRAAACTPARLAA